MNTSRKVILLNTELVRAVSEHGEITVYIRMANGQWAVQRPYTADVRGQIGALTLAIDALAGKIILTETVKLDDREFEAPKRETVEIQGPKMIGPPKVGFIKGIQPKA